MRFVLLLIATVSAVQLQTPENVAIYKANMLKEADRRHTYTMARHAEHEAERKSNVAADYVGSKAYMSAHRNDPSQTPK